MLGTRFYERALKVLSVIQSHSKSGITAGGIARILINDGLDTREVEEIIRIAMEQGLVFVYKEFAGFTLYALTNRTKL